MAYITKRGSSYSVRYTYQDEHGKSCDKWESFSTKEEAVKRQKQIEHELATGNFLIPSTVTVAEFLMDWLPKQCSKHKWAPKTYQSNLALIQNLIIPYIGEMQMQKLRPYHIEALYDTLSKTPCGQYVGGKRRDLSPCLLYTSSISNATILFSGITSGFRCAQYIRSVCENKTKFFPYSGKFLIFPTRRKKVWFCFLLPFAILYKMNFYSVFHLYFYRRSVPA